MTDPWGVPQTSQPQSPQSPGSGSGIADQQQGPYGAPLQPDAPIPLQHDPNAVGAPVAYGYPVAPARQSNGLALAGAITSFIPLVGLVLSIIGLVRSKALGGAGRTAGTVGIVVSVVFTAVWGFAGYKIGNSTLADPGCITAESGVSSLLSALNADEQSLNTAASSGDKTQLAAAEQKLVSDMNGVKTVMDHSQSIATHANVKTAITKVDTDLTTFIGQFQQITAGTGGDSNALASSGQALETDGNALDSLCTNVTNG